MIRIKDLIVNENEIVYIGKFDEDNKLRVRTSKEVWFDIPNATFDDIEWNYGTPQETQRKIQKELCKSCYYRDTISNKLKELEEDLEAEKSISSNLAQRILKAIEYIEKHIKYECDRTYGELRFMSHHLYDNFKKKDLLKILKGK